MNYQFDSEVAEEYGVDCAIMIHSLQYWVIKNKANDKHFYDGHYWTYNSNKAFVKMFPFWSEQNIRTILNRLKANGVITTASYNPNPYDKTLWYAFVDEERWITRYVRTNKSICENQHTDMLELTNGDVRTNEPIPDSNTNSNTDMNIDVDYFCKTWNGPLSANCENISKIVIFDKERVAKLKSVVKMIADTLKGGEKPERYILKKFQEEYRKSDYLMGQKGMKRPITVDFVLDNYQKIAEGYYKDNNN